MPQDEKKCLSIPGLTELITNIKGSLDEKQDTLTFDTEPIENSTNPITSGAVYTALQNIQPSSAPSFTSNVFAISNGFTSGDFGVGTQINE